MNESFTSRFKKRSIELIGKTKPSPLIMSLLWFAINSVISLLYMFLSGYYDAANELTEIVLSGVPVASIDFAALVGRYSTWGGSILALVLLLLGNVVGVGFSWYCLRVARGETPEYRSLFDGFTYFLKVLWLNILTEVLVILQLCLFIVPGIIALFRYSQARFIMYENPEYSAWRCLRESSKMMRGYKGSYFGLLISFIGWFLLGYLLSLYFPVAIMDIWINIYWGIAAALFYVRIAHPNEPVVIDG